MHSCVISSDFVCVHKSIFWNVVNARVHKQFYGVSCGDINNLIWIFSLHFGCSHYTLTFKFIGLEVTDY